MGFLKLWLKFRFVIFDFFVFVPRAGVEPARPNGHMALNHACLPISAPGQCRMPVEAICDPAGTRTQDPLIKSEML